MNGRWDLRIVEVVIGKIKPLKVNKPEKGAIGVDRTIEKTATQIKSNHMTSNVVTLDSVP